MRERKSAKLNLQQQQQHQNGHLPPFKLAKLLDPDASWDKVPCSVLPHCMGENDLSPKLQLHVLNGVLSLLVHWKYSWNYSAWFVVLSTGIIYAYYALVLKVDEEEFGGHGALLQEGLFASICLFLLVWILVYSLAHF
ncbi:putative Rab5-interacting protein [Handroanthus impetiginosus]|uniref:Putative Rab5-interacting protein n=1 Tax=Handroanthus impetiginosus TaxID=429701 RepID=A0A2G9GZK9_9LAMI|nr:putative Rab5-interacting protein [Handroanthus impetiginosus]